MQIRHNELEIPEDKPFENDKLLREKLEPPLTEFITQASGSLVLALDGSWGSGKTTFLNMWKVKLEQKGHACLYLNAWKNDFVQDPLVAVIGELSRAIEEFTQKFTNQESLEDEKKRGEIRDKLDKAKKIGGLIAKRSLVAGVKLATLNIIDADAISERVVADLSSGVVDDLVKDYETGKSEIDEFKKSLISLIDEIKQKSSEAKVVIIIDELDRCRPTYAVQLLERIKHLFDVEGIVFILGIDRSQLNHSIRALYGSDFDAQGYLRRFIDVDYRLPKPEASLYCTYLFDYFGINGIIKRRQEKRHINLQFLKPLLESLMTASGMSLRDQEQTVSRLRIVLQTIPLDENLYPVTLSMLLFLREWDRKTYTSLLEETIYIEEFLNRLPYSQQASKLFNGDYDFYFTYRDMLEALLIHSILEKDVTLTSKNLESSLSELERYEQIKSNSNDIVRELIEKIIKNSGSGLIVTRDRLEIAYQFVSQEES